MSGFLFIAMLTVIMHDEEEDWKRSTVEKDSIARDTVKDTVGRDFALYADDLVTGCIRTMRAVLHSILREGALYGKFFQEKSEEQACVPGRFFLMKSRCRV